MGTSTERNQIDDQISLNGPSKRRSIVIIAVDVLVFAIVVVVVIGIAQVIASLYQLPSMLFFSLKRLDCVSDSGAGEQLKLVNDFQLCAVL